MSASTGKDGDFSGDTAAHHTDSDSPARIDQE
jgi:hypothetical protein